MKTFLLLRHAKSSWKDAGLSDHDRPLNKRGKRDAPRIGQLIAAEGLVPDVILSSTAKRARKTAMAVAEHCGFSGEVQQIADFYLAPADLYIDVVCSLPGEVDRVMVVGHNPGMANLLASLTDQHLAYPTGALAHIRLPIDDWSALTSRTTGQLIQMWLPRELEE